MPCIIDSAHPTSKNKGNLWQSYCGKTVYFSNNPFGSPEEALKSGKPICRACRKEAGLPNKEPLNKNLLEPYVLYRALGGVVKALQVVGETDRNYRLKSGDLQPKRESIRDLYWRRSGSEASNAFFTKSKQEAITKAKKQLKLRRDYLQNLIDEANKLELKLDGYGEN